MASAERRNRADDGAAGNDPTRIVPLDQRRNAEALEGLRGMFERARERVNSDPVLVQHQRAEDAE